MKRIKLKNILLESPDEIQLDPDFVKTYKNVSRYKLSWDDTDSFVFGYIQGELFGNKSDNHVEFTYYMSDDDKKRLAKIVGYEKSIKGYYSIPLSKFPVDRSDYKYAGRLWNGTQVISFWDYPDKSKLKQIMNDLKKQYGYNITPNWYIQVIDKGGKYETPKLTKDMFGSAVWDTDESWAKLVKIKDYIGSEKQRGKEIQHVKPPMLKQRTSIPKGWGSRKLPRDLKPDETMAQYHTRKKTSENQIKLKSLLYESSFIAIGRIGDSDNGGDWAPPGQKKVLDDKDLCGYKQIKFPIADNPFGKSQSFRLEFIRVSNPNLNVLANDVTDDPTLDVTKDEKENKEIEKTIKSFSKAAGGKEFKLAKSIPATAKEKKSDEIVKNITEKYIYQIYKILNENIS